MKRALVVVVFLAGSGHALAQGLSGASLDLQWYSPDLSSPFGPSYPIVVGPGAEFAGFWYGNLDVDVTDSQLIVNVVQDISFGAATYNGLLLSDTTSGLAPITSVTLNPSTSVTGFSASRVYWTSDSFGINLQGLTALNGEQVVLDIVVPAPGAVALLTGASLAAFRRRR